MDVFSAIQKRFSCRKYLEKDVDFHDIAVLLEAGRFAPSSGNLQAWKFIVVQDKHRRESLAEACQKQYWMTHAPVHIVVTAEVGRVEQFYGVRGERLYSVQNCAAAIENMLLAATGLGLASCWVGYFDEEAVRDACGIPKSSRPQAIITIGYAAKEERLEKTGPYNIAFFEQYGNRIENPALALKSYSDVFQQKLEKGKDKGARYGKKVTEHLKRAHSKVKEHIERIRKKCFVA